MSAMTYVVLVLLGVIAALVLACIRLAGWTERHIETRGQILPTARQLRRWRRDRLVLATENRRIR